MCDICKRKSESNEICRKKTVVMNPKYFPVIRLSLQVIFGSALAGS